MRIVTRAILVLLATIAQLGCAGGAEMREVMVFPMSNEGCQADCANVRAEGEEMIECGNAWPDHDVNVRVHPYDGPLTVCRFEAP